MDLLQKYWCPCLFIAIGAYFLILGIRSYLYILHSQKWMKTKGRIISSHVDGKFERTNGLEFIYISKPVVKYEYSVGSEKYANDQISLIQINTSSAKRAQRVIDKYPPNTEVEVFYNPNKPDEAVLELSSPSTALIFLLIGIILAGIGVYLAIS